MNRADLAWALDAALPHVGRTRGPTVGLQSHDGKLHVYATDGYTAGIARIEGPFDWSLHLPRQEATDLMRFVRPSRVAHHDEQISVMLHEQEMHVGIVDDSAVFELTDSAVTLDYLLDRARFFASQELDVRELVQQPALVAKFGKAQRHDDDRMRWYPIQDKALVTVGSDFLGLVAGMERTDEGRDTLSSFLQNAESMGSAA